MTYPRRLIEHYAPIFQAAFEQHSPASERITWDIFLDVVPTSNGPTPSVVVLTCMPGAIVGQLHQNVAVLPLTIPEDDVPGLVFRILESLSAERSKALGSQLITPPHMNGHGGG